MKYIRLFLCAIFGCLLISKLITRPFFLKKIHRFERLSKFKKDEKKIGAILLVGDSQIELFDSSKIKTESPVINHGISSETTHGLKKRIGVEIKSSPKSIFIQIGINDLSNQVEISEIIYNYKEILKAVKSNKLIENCFVISLYPIGESRNMDKNYIDIFNEKLKLNCEQMSCNYIDVFQHLVNQKGYLDDQFSNDGLHLNEEGQNILADSINNVLKHIIRI